MKSLRPFLIASFLGLSVTVLAAPAFDVRWSKMTGGDQTQIGIVLTWDDLRSASAKSNDNEVDCDRYDDNDNFEAGPNLIMTLARRLCIADRNAREVEESAGGQVEGRADPFPGSSVQAVVTRGLARAGRETAIAQAGDRVVLRVFPSLNRDITITIRNLSASALPATPGTQVPDFVFSIEAEDRGNSVPTLSAEVRLSAVYTNAELANLDEQRLVLAWLDPATSQWTDAPKQAADPKNNYISASVVNMGAYTVYQR